MKFWDSSAVTALLMAEPGTEGAQAVLAEDDGVALWWATMVECLSAMCRLKREGRLDSSAFQALRKRLDTITARADEIEPSEAVREAGLRLLQRHSLRAADALQLAAAFVWAGGKPADRGFVSLDKRLREAAAQEGFVVLPDDVG